VVSRNFYHIFTPLSLYEGEKQENPVPSPKHKGGLGRGRKYLIHQS